METINTLEKMVQLVAQRKTRKKVAVVCGTDSSTKQSVIQGIEQGWIEAVCIGPQKAIYLDNLSADLHSYVTYIDVDDAAQAAELAVELVRNAKADVLMKGLINTDVLLKAVLNKEHGILPHGEVLTHIAVAEIPGYDKLLCFTDAAVIPYPTPEQRMMQIKYITALSRELGVEKPKVALIHCTEKINAKHFPFTAHFPQVIELAQGGAFGSCIVDGPMDLKVACNLESMQVKNIQSLIQGEADAVVFPDIEAGNLFYKTITLFASAQVAGILQGTLSPVVLPSRGDNAQSKFNSLALACLKG